MNHHKQEKPAKWQNGQITPASTEDSYSIDQSNSGQAQGLRRTLSSRSNSFGFSGGMVGEPEALEFTDERALVLSRPQEAVPPVAPPTPRTQFEDISEESDEDLDEQIARLQAKKREKARRKAAAAQQNASQSPPPTTGRLGHSYGLVTILGQNADVHAGDIYSKDTKAEQRRQHNYAGFRVDSRPGKHQQRSLSSSTLTLGDMPEDAYIARRSRC